MHTGQGPTGKTEQFNRQSRTRRPLAECPGHGQGASGTTLGWWWWGGGGWGAAMIQGRSATGAYYWASLTTGRNIPTCHHCASHQPIGHTNMAPPGAMLGAPRKLPVSIATRQIPGKSGGGGGVSGFCFLFWFVFSKKNHFFFQKFFKKKKTGQTAGCLTSASPQGTRPRQYRARIPNGWPAIGRCLARQ